MIGMSRRPPARPIFDNLSNFVKEIPIGGDLSIGVHQSSSRRCTRSTGFFRGICYVFRLAVACRQRLLKLY